MASIFADASPRPPGSTFFTIFSRRMIDYHRMKRLEPDPGKLPISITNVLSVLFIALGVMALFKRYKDKEITRGFGQPLHI